MNSTKAFLLIFVLFQVSISEGQLKVGFYSQTCPNAESIVKSVVQKATLAEPRMPPILLRLHFHDCFVEGCDGSILVDNGDNSEKNAGAHQGVEGFGQVEKAKEVIEAKCPGVVSCADIVALAARDAVAMAGGPRYEVETGRRDGRVSDKSLADDMPDANDSIDALKSKFRNKGLSEKELVLLSGGAHTIGTTACFFVVSRLYSFGGQKNSSDPEINPKFLSKLKSLCPEGANGERIPLDAVTGDKFDSQILVNIKNGLAVIASDARLYDDGITKKVVDSYVGSKMVAPFGDDFARAMVKMGRIGVKTGSSGEIRRVCNAFN